MREKDRNRDRDKERQRQREREIYIERMCMGRIGLIGSGWVWKKEDVHHHTDIRVLDWSLKIIVIMTN